MTERCPRFVSVQWFDHKERLSPEARRQHFLVSVLRVLVVSRVVRRQWWPVYSGVVESTVALIPAASLHHKVATHRPLGHV